MDQDEHKDGRTRERAYQLWEQEGRPEGRHEDHWHQASQEFAGEGEREGGYDPEEEMVPNPIGVPPSDILPPGSQPTGIDGPVGGAIRSAGDDGAPGARGTAAK
ncbi:MAG: hypothetical protein K0R85_667 [Devosia sp.]|jgi:hypothetical protein|nr:hypothetical protein [Devosia sp.]